MSKILFLSNGHGEDLSGSLIGKAFKKIGHHVDAFPLVGNGESYKRRGVKIIGKTKSFSTGGMGYTSLKGRILELIQGQIIYLLKRVYLLLLVSSRYDLLFVVGDVIPITAGWLTGLPVVTYLVAYSSRYEGKLRLPWPCFNCLSSDKFLKVYTRDKLTEFELKKKLSYKVEFIGNPFMDPFLAKTPNLPKHKRRLGILPGSRMPEVGENLRLILSVVEYISNLKHVSTDISFDVALVPSLDDAYLKKIVTLDGWSFCYPSDKDHPIKIIKNKANVNIYRNSFVKIVQSSNVLISMAGTAAEQASILGKSIVQLEGNGPQFNASFAEAQRRLLGSNVYCANGSVKDKKNMIKTCDFILYLLENSCNKRLLNEQGDQFVKELLELNRVEGVSELMAKKITNSFLRN